MTEKEQEPKVVVSTTMNDKTWLHVAGKFQPRDLSDAEKKKFAEVRAFAQKGWDAKFELGRPLAKQG
jgi:hypothetical protein